MKKLCPHCGSNHFKAVVKRPGAIQITDDGATILKEVESFAYEVAECLKCKTKVTNDELVETLGKPCTSCSNVFNEEDLVEGLCPVCNAMKNRADLASASPQDLIKMILELEKTKGATQATKIDVKIEKAEATVDTVNEKAEEEARKRSEAAKKAAETRKANAEKKAQEEANNKVKEEVVHTPVIPEPISETEAPNFELPNVDEAGVIVPPGMANIDEPF